MAFPFARPRRLGVAGSQPAGVTTIIKRLIMKAIRTAGTGATFVVIRDLREYETSKRTRKRIERRKRKALQRLDNQTF
jgi:hypothetical protein